MAWSKLVDLELDDEDKIDEGLPVPVGVKPKGPDYPWGLRISLTHRELKKLGLKPDCDIGDMIDMRCFAVVTSISTDENRGSEPSCRVELQIQKMAVENEMTEAD